MENKRILFAEASDRKMKKLVDNSAQRNTKKSTTYAETIYVCLPLEIIGGLINKPLSSLLIYQRIMPLAERNWLSSKISQLPLKLCFLANWSFFGQSFSLEYYPPIYQQLKGVHLLNIHVCIRMYACIYTYYNYKLECSVAISTTEKDCITKHENLQ